ncbi:MAG: hypothetical protein IPG50_07360 [Myxococcales bacterium]|nr:hypothetical protein [Myxococcales bacterium]
MKRPQLEPWVAAIYDAPLEPEEFERRLAKCREELEGEELENILSLTDWFQRRYPTAKARLSYARRNAKQWASQMTNRPVPR